eukprot:115692-Chlamydomonas_euryale.AAC.7
MQGRLRCLPGVRASTPPTLPRPFPHPHHRAGARLHAAHILQPLSPTPPRGWCTAPHLHASSSSTPFFRSENVYTAHIPPRVSPPPPPGRCTAPHLSARSSVTSPRMSASGMRDTKFSENVHTGPQL